MKILFDDKDSNQRHFSITACDSLLRVAVNEMLELRHLSHDRVTLEVGVTARVHLPIGLLTSYGETPFTEFIIEVEWTEQPCCVARTILSRGFGQTVESSSYTSYEETPTADELWMLVTRGMRIATA